MNRASILLYLGIAAILGAAVAFYFAREANEDAKFEHSLDCLSSACGSAPSLNWYAPAALGVVGVLLIFVSTKDQAASGG